LEGFFEKTWYLLGPLEFLIPWVPIWHWVPRKAKEERRAGHLDMKGGHFQKGTLGWHSSGISVIAGQKRGKERTRELILQLMNFGEGEEPFWMLQIPFNRRF